MEIHIKPSGKIIMTFTIALRMRRSNQKGVEYMNGIKTHRVREKGVTIVLRMRKRHQKGIKKHHNFLKQQ